MKKFIIACLLSLPLATFAENDFGVNIPEWSDFAPKAFVDVKEPKKLQKLNVNNQYWYKRRVEFENELDNCKALEANDERFSCYETLKTNQYKMNNDYNARIEAQMQNASSIPGMGSPTDSMIPIGGYMNSMTKFMPNEIR